MVGLANIILWKPYVGGQDVEHNNFPIAVRIFHEFRPESYYTFTGFKLAP